MRTERPADYSGLNVALACHRADRHGHAAGANSSKESDMKIRNDHLNQHVRGRNRTQAVTNGDNVASDFKSMLTAALGKKGRGGVSEEDIFAALTQQRVNELATPEAIAKFETRLERHRQILNKKLPNGSEELAAKFALRDIVRNGLMTNEEARDIYSMAFSGAQLDSNKNQLSDGIGTGEVKSTKPISALVNQLEKIIADYVDGNRAYTERRLGERTVLAAVGSGAAAAASGSSAGEGVPVDGANGFLFKPVSDTSGKLVILLPSSMTHDVRAVNLKTSSGKLVEAGQYAGIGNGNREHFRYNMPGSGYPKDLVVEVTLNNGKTVNYKIPDPSQRYD